MGGSGLVPAVLVGEAQCHAMAAYVQRHLSVLHLLLCSSLRCHYRIPPARPAQFQERPLSMLHPLGQPHHRRGAELLLQPHHGHQNACSSNFFIPVLPSLALGIIAANSPFTCQTGSCLAERERYFFFPLTAFKANRITMLLQPLAISIKLRASARWSPPSPSLLWILIFFWKTC